MAKSKVSLTVNGQAVETLAEPRTLLIHFLREELDITGLHIGCDTSQCGACTVDLDGKSVNACTVLVVQADGADIVIIEGMANPDGTPHVLKEAFREHHGLQCGYCTPGMITRVDRLLNRYAKSVLNRRSVVMILSDGYDTGDAPAASISREMRRLRGRARRIVWLNPLLGWRSYEPVARAMAAALPHVDCFAAARTLETLAAIEGELSRL